MPPVLLASDDYRNRVESPLRDSLDTGCISYPGARTGNSFAGPDALFIPEDYSQSLGSSDTNSLPALE